LNIQFSIVNRLVRVRFEKLGSAASHIENYFMCQDLRMEFTAIEIEGFEKKEKGSLRGIAWVVGVSYFAFWQVEIKCKTRNTRFLIILDITR
jgi:hypothetical protein